MNFTTGEDQLLLSGLTHSVAIDFDYQEQMLYWTDIQSQNSFIYRIPLNETQSKKQVVPNDMLFVSTKNVDLFLIIPQ